MGKNKDRDRVELMGIVMDSHPGGMFTVETATQLKIIATVCGRIRQNQIKILSGDKVIVEVSPYDIARGRIIKRLSANE